ncbi:MAG: hypothetical protein J5956_02665 [Ruminococcus sp.]|nr:hypothetical protein [Ruminococcus sp.]
MGLLETIRKRYPAPSEKEKHDHRNVKALVINVKINSDTGRIIDVEKLYKKLRKNRKTICAAPKAKVYFAFVPRKETKNPQF